MRCTQFMGLSEKAYEFLNQNQQTEKRRCSCPDCKTEHIELAVTEKYRDAQYLGMREDGPILQKYLLKDGTWVYEYDQAVPWSSGPCIFLALSTDPIEPEKHPIEETLWSQEEIDNA